MGASTDTNPPAPPSPAVLPGWADGIARAGVSLVMAFLTFVLTIAMMSGSTDAFGSGEVLVTPIVGGLVLLLTLLAAAGLRLVLSIACRGSGPRLGTLEESRG